MHEFREHTGELELHLRAGTLAELFAEAGLALAEMMLGEEGAGDLPESAHADVTLEARDGAALLVAWIDELVWRAETAHAVFARFDIRSVEETDLRATIHGVSPRSFQSPVKAATYHRLYLGEEDGAFVATVVLDV